MHTKDVLRNGRRFNLFTYKNVIQYIWLHIDINIVKHFIFADDNPSVLLKMMSFSSQEQFYASNINPPFTTVTLRCLNIININTLFIFQITSFLRVEERFWLVKCDEENKKISEYLYLYIFFEEYLKEDLYNVIYVSSILVYSMQVIFVWLLPITKINDKQLAKILHRLFLFLYLFVFWGRFEIFVNISGHWPLTNNDKGFGFNFILNLF